MTTNKTVLSWIDEIKALVNPDSIMWIDGSNEQLEKLKEALKGDNTDAINNESEELTKRFYTIAEKLYQNAKPEEGAAPATDENGNPVYDADYKVVDDENEKKN